ncbi:MAG: transglycosylase SLT domain-containing protein [Deltaproteobacteria bacterium]|nr:transglycosylase SLT domain-containing protein [Deltaproteobacteria bacterium]MBT5833575.1 transglycosylase SLT domain-containing protein [Deltaproteobacteria bacterium]
MKTKTRKFNFVILSVLLMVGASTYAAEDPFSKFAKDVKIRDQAMLKAVEQIEERWDRFYDSTVEDYYVYSKDGRVRRRANFSDESPDKGFLEVAVVDVKSKKEAQKLLSKAVESALRERAGKQELLKDQVQLNQQPLTKKNVRRRLEELKKKVTETIVSTKKGKKTVYSVRLEFAPDHLKKRAQVYAKLVKKYAGKYGVPPALIFAVMHTESYFNPVAKSSVAYGLMQLVPKSGARDAYKKVFKRDKIVHPSYLYVPENNIRLGVAYLGILEKQFKRAKNRNLRTYLMISAYNTGAGNVSRAFIGKTRLSAAFAKINSFSSNAGFKHLVRNLPYEETRHYLERVNKRMPLYR